jgi:hypothetical protein
MADSEKCNGRGAHKKLFLPDSEKCNRRGHITETLFLPTTNYILDFLLPTKDSHIRVNFKIHIF